MKFTEKYNDKTYIISQDKRQIVSLKDHGESRKYVGRNPGKLELSVFRVDNGICRRFDLISGNAPVYGLDH